MDGSDSSLVLKALKRVLSEDGYRIRSTTDTGKGFELLATNRVNVVLSDQRMPGMSGTEFLSKVKSLHPHTIRIALSGYADMHMVTDAINQGAIYKFLNKPISNESLRRTLKKAFEHSESASGGVSCDHDPRVSCNHEPDGYREIMNRRGIAEHRDLPGVPTRYLAHGAPRTRRRPP